MSETFWTVALVSAASLAAVALVCYTAYQCAQYYFVVAQHYAEERAQVQREGHDDCGGDGCKGQMGFVGGEPGACVVDDGDG